jgi:hypothetical protein
MTMTQTLEITTAGSKDVGPAARKKLSSLIKFYMSKPHPFAACVRDNTKRFGKDGAERVCATLKDIGSGTTKWRKGRAKAELIEDAVDAMLEAADGNVEGLIAAMVDASAIEDLQQSKPLLTTVPDVQIVKTGIEYPLSSGPCTFTPDDLAAAVAAQSDPSIPQPRIWIGHPDDKRIHGERSGGVPSGEPAVGKVTDMRLTEDGHCIVGDLTGVPVWLSNILASAFPSRSIEGRFNLKTPTGKQHRLVINGLALLGVTWPGVLTIDDIASLYSEKGPNIAVTEASADQPITITAAAKRQLSAQVTVEDLRRAWYESNRGDPEKFNWWIRSIYVEPNELIVDADDGGTLLRQPFKISGDKVKFLKPKKVKIKYVNASHGGVEAEPINENRDHIAVFEDQVLHVTVPTGNYIEIKLGGNKK